MTYNSSKDGILDIAEDIRHIYGKTPLIIQSDLTVRSEAENTIRKTIEEFGRIDLLVNNAGSAYMTSSRRLKRTRWT